VSKLFRSKSEALARFYDLEYRDYVEDSDFYVQYALALDPGQELPVLELGCGTGRLLGALSNAGFSVTGVDKSGEMLSITRKRLSNAPGRGRVELIQADMLDLPGRIGGPYNMAFCALNTFAYLTSTADQLKMLRGLAPHLVTHGILIVDLTPPFPPLFAPDDGLLVHQGSFHDDEGKVTLHKLVWGRADNAAQTHDVTIFYDAVDVEGNVTRITDELTLRWTGRYEMELLLEVAGYRVEKVYGGYDLEDFEDGCERMIFVART
jgi:SAM-dependent methyltransferase